MTRYRRALIATIIAMSVAGCSSSPSAGPQSPAGGHSAAEYAACLQSHGLTMEQYTADDGSTQSRPDKDRNDITKITQATEACKALMPTADVVTKAPSAADIDAKRRYAACIRSKGVPDFPDPDPRTGDFVMDGDLGARIKGNPATAGAMQACQDQLPVTTGGGVIGG
jgi:hypothetical protein